MLDALSGLQQVLIGLALAIGASLGAWRLLHVAGRRRPPGPADAEQAMAQVDAHLGHSIGGDHEPWDGVKRLESGDTHVGF